MDNIKICSLNCQGLGDPRKRRDVLNHLRSKKFSMLCLQDTHFTKSIEHTIQSEWGYKVLFSSFSSQSRGVAIFINNTFEYKLHNTISDERGNSLILDIEIDKHRITLINLYGPNNDCPEFYENLEKQIIQRGNKDILMVGDWNLLLNPDLDGRNYKHVNNPRSRQSVLKLMSNLNLYDVMREESGEELIFTWKRKLQNGRVQRGRLDFFLVSESLINYTREESISHGYRSDHSLISLSLVFNEMQRCKTFWKFNNSLLRNSQYSNEVKQVILDVKKQYAATPYNRENVDDIDDELFQTVIDPQLFFEMLLLEIRGKTLSFASFIKKKENEEIVKLESEIKVLEAEDIDENFDIIKTKEEDLRCIREKRLQGTLIRSRGRWIEEGEKPSKYFLSLESRNFVSKK